MDGSAKWATAWKNWNGTVKVQLTEPERHQCVHAGTRRAAVDHSLICLPAGSVMFPANPETGKEFDVTAPRNPRNFSKEFARRANLLGLDGQAGGQLSSVLIGRWSPVGPGLFTGRS